jgi:uncharacterized membrane protein YeaQ/YmgE (transglycosylase-associated protein family)
MLFGILVWLVVGGIIGWLASVAMRTDAQQGILINIIVGVVGSYVGGALFAPFLQIGALGGYLAAFAGSVLLLGIVNLVRRGRLR